MVTQVQLDKLHAQAIKRQGQGYFDKVAEGDQRAAGLFVRLVANDLNANGNPNLFGWLTKNANESNVEGYAEDALACNASPNDLHNVVDMIAGAGAEGANIPSAYRLSDLKERRPHNVWEAPRPLTAEELDYLGGSEDNGEVDPPAGCPMPPRDEQLDALTQFDKAYEDAGRDNRCKKGHEPLHMDNEGIAVWFGVYIGHRQQGMSHEAAVQQTKEEMYAAGLPKPKK